MLKMKKSILMISLLLPLAAMSGIAQAGSAITDKSYWPSDSRSTTYRTAVPSGDWRSALASDTRTPQYRAIPSYTSRKSDWTYQGGPKSPTTRGPQF